VRGEPLDLERHSTRTDVKAVTYHQLSVRETAEGVVVTVFLDI
jgi:SHS2 domain-containing protein